MEGEKVAVGLRIPKELNTLLEEYSRKIGITRQAYILELLYRKLQSEKRDTDE